MTLNILNKASDISFFICSLFLNDRGLYWSQFPARMAADLFLMLFISLKINLLLDLGYFLKHMLAVGLHV